MAAEQQVIYQQLQPTFLEKRLNELGAEGWQLQDISTNMIVRKGGGIFLLPSGYYFDSHFFTLEKTGEQHQYRCRLFRCIKPDDDLAAINEEIRKQNADAFTLRQILHVSGISDIPERPSRGTAAHFCIFEKSMTLHLADGQTPEETKGTTIMSNSFTRTFDSASIQALRGTSLFQHRMLSDIRGGAVFPAVRNGRMDFYHGGGKLFTYRNNDFETHLKYASVLRYPGDYITETELTTAAPITSFSDSDAYARIKENCARYAGPEAAGVASEVGVIAADRWERAERYGKHQGAPACPQWRTPGSPDAHNDPIPHGRGGRG
ncbi:MAG TPA: hypothetical protein VHR86_03185 [Armatimonadota bacterium]|nr:hypothetical protein [Armatimonadota bacterium]